MRLVEVRLREQHVDNERDRSLWRDGARQDPRERLDDDPGWQIGHGA